MSSHRCRHTVGAIALAALVVLPALAGESGQPRVERKVKSLSAGFRSGLIVAVVVIFLLLSANFQSLRLALAVSTVPVVFCGVVLLLWITGTMLNRTSSRWWQKGRRFNVKDAKPSSNRNKRTSLFGRCFD
ncbi:MAG: hypothetical protein K8R23_17940 [Chthoniobacter sp.]|nr:hypothetical protein [Chthoniobacter sp.]